MRWHFMVAIPFDKDASVIVLYVKIRSGDLFLEPRMALDTGASYVMISWEMAEKLGLLSKVSADRIEMITASGTEMVPVVDLPSVSVAGMEIPSVKAIIHDLPEKSYVDGLLGLSFLRNFDLRLNFKEGLLELS